MLEEHYPGFTPVVAISTRCAPYDSEAKAYVVVLSDGETNILSILEPQGDSFAVMADHRGLIPKGLYHEKSIWLNASAMGDRPYLWYQSPPVEEHFYLVFSKAESGDWIVSHAEFDGYDEGAGLAGYTVCHRGTALNVQGNAASVLIEVPNPLDLRLSHFDLAAAEVYCRGSISFFPGPPFGPIPSQLGNAFPQGQLVSFPSGGSYPVYTGPGEQYMRGWEASGTLSTDQPVTVLGQEGDWLLVYYPVPDSPAFYRYGYISAAALPQGVTLPPLAWTPLQGTLSEGTLDPTYPRGDDWHPQVIQLAALENEWLYVEATTGAGAKTRGFVWEGLFTPGGEPSGIE